MRAVILAAKPQGAMRESDFALADLPTPIVGEGELLVETLYLSLDPGLRNLLGAEDGYITPIAVGTALSTTVVGRVLASRHPDFAAGELVVGTGSAGETCVIAPGPMCWKVDPAALPVLSNALGVQGAIGLTAYFGMLAVGNAKAGETVLVSGAAGAVGSIAGQLAKIRGCRVIGIAGGPIKAQRLRKEFGFDTAIDHRGLSPEALEQAIAAACPEGIDLFFDNVGGIQLDAALASMNWGGRIAVCGQISGYDGQEPPAMRNLFRIVAKVLRIEGFLVFTFADRFQQAIAELGAWAADGRLHAREEIVHGLDRVPAAFLSLFAGTNQGKLIVQI